MTDTIGVVHLVRKQNGPEPLRQFLASYQRHPAGAPHELVFLCKGFRGPRDLAEVEPLLAPFPGQRLYVDDRGFDLGAYFTAAGRLRHERLLFLNSHSEILADDWLKRMSDRMLDTETALVGATGSWQGAVVEPMAPMPNNSWVSRLRAIGRSRRHARRTVQMLERFPLTPNPHIRTNAFLVERALFLDLEAPKLDTKRGCWMFESGKRSMTRQLAARGVKLLVVGRDGQGYEPTAWRESFTFRAGQQENLLIADNRTREFQTASPERRRVLAEHAWGRPTESFETRLPEIFRAA